MKKALGAVLVLILAGLAAGQDREKKTYELLYEDVQLLKQQVQRLDKKLDSTAEDLRLIKDLFGQLQTTVKALQTDQARTGDGVRAVPAQYQVLTDKLGQIESLLSRLADDIASIKSQPAAPVDPEAKPKDEPPPGKKPRDKEPADKPDTPAKPPIGNLSAVEVFNTAQADYGKGNYDLAIDGFAMYRESFPASPLADNALYMIGECFYSQKKYQKAIDALDDLIITFPLSDKIEAAYLKKGYALVELKKKDEAVGVFKYLVSKYPIAEEARQAQEKLKELLER